MKYLLVFVLALFSFGAVAAPATSTLSWDAPTTRVDGTTTLLSESGTFTIFDSAGAEVAGQVFPTALTLNEPGDYAGIIESDVEFLPNRRYTAVVTIGTDSNSRAVFNVYVRPVERGRD